MAPSRMRIGRPPGALSSNRWSTNTRSDLVRVGLFFDGVTFKILSDYYLHEHWRQARLSFTGIEGLVKLYLEEAIGGPIVVTERHLFIGVAGSRGRQGKMPGLAPAFARVMRLSGVQAHCIERSSVGEKGVDTALTIEMLRLAWTRRIDVAVLLATDGDFAPLARAVRADGVPVVLLGFHLPHSGRQPVCLSAGLTDSVTAAVDMIELIERPSGIYRLAVEKLFCSQVQGSSRIERCA